MDEFQNTFYTGDNLYVLYGLNSGLADLIYLDPPFNSRRLYAAPPGTKAAGSSFKDVWTWKDVDEKFLGSLAIHYPALARYIACAGTLHSKAMMAYLAYMAQRVIEMRRVLKDTGTLYLHCDTSASHYLKLLLDGVFGKSRFGNDIAWCYTGPSRAKKRFPAKHDVILRYTKSEDAVFNAGAVRIPYARLNTGATHSIFKEARTLSEEGKVPEDWWVDIPSGGHISPAERVGYPTQKPLALLRRIIAASSNPGDLVLDPFCGCATTCVASEQLGRKWVGIDIEQQAVGILSERLGRGRGPFKGFTAAATLPVRTDAPAVSPTSRSAKERLYREQSGACNACGAAFDPRHLTIDHIVPKTAGGGDYYENYQLLCPSCRRLKAERPLDYLRMQIAIHERLLKQQPAFGDPEERGAAKDR